ncbi:MAG: 3-isopropylmalate dehydratase [Candidatus Woesearchaeota archaeon]|nr:3-isopropylmalate dehydratase [Candidatus Woesearchaeota archaeon]
MISGKTLKYDANDINTDVIWPGKYTYVQIPPEEMQKHAMETFDPDFGRKLAGKSILVVGTNMGCGSSREQASECLKYSGIKAIIAKSFARIFYRNSINLGLPVIESPELVDAISDGDDVQIDLANGEALVNDKTFRIPTYPQFVMEILEAGGLIEHIRRQKQ